MLYRVYGFIKDHIFIIIFIGCFLIVIFTLLEKM